MSVSPDPTVMREDVCRYPPCACPECGPGLREGDAAVRAPQSSGGEVGLPVRDMAALWALWRV
ncbi:hypothetical protein [Streptomyces iconiensis]|uniref:Uncharacterized protein n=1 Tax=Streptomyces iconiensis TaxID=1384038 RepID=A0ABT6ZUV4_9ACTN|nr:hypothetical protein [Streptomyces iconiensis]MDJ1132845.1 hypothetical protein [Streptomyces iconiensis]